MHFIKLFYFFSKVQIFSSYFGFVVPAIVSIYYSCVRKQWQIIDHLKKQITTLDLDNLSSKVYPSVIAVSKYPNTCIITTTPKIRICKIIVLRKFQSRFSHWWLKRLLLVYDYCHATYYAHTKSIASFDFSGN